MGFCICFTFILGTSWNIWPQKCAVALPWYLINIIKFLTIYQKGNQNVHAASAVGIQENSINNTSKISVKKKNFEIKATFSKKCQRREGNGNDYLKKSWTNVILCRWHTDGCNILHTLLVKQYNDLLDRQSSERDRDEFT